MFVQSHASLFGCVHTDFRVWKHGGNLDVCSKMFDPAKEQHVAPTVRKAPLLRASVASSQNADVGHSVALETSFHEADVNLPRVLTPKCV